MDAGEVRRQSVEKARRFGYEIPIELPLLDDFRLREEAEVARRCVARYAAVAVAYGFDRAAARRWLDRERVTEALAPSERAFLEGGGSADELKAGVESLWALCWVLGVVEELDFGRLCGDNLISLFPDLKEDEPLALFMERVRLRPVADVAAGLDLAYCLHVAIVRQAFAGGGRAAEVPGYVVVERRHALEWVASDEDWDEISLDT